MKTKHNLLKIGTFLLVLVAVLLLDNTTTWAQCPMCKAAAEQNLLSGGTYAKGLNKGILYLLATPYLLAISIGGLWWYKNHKPSQD